MLHEFNYRSFVVRWLACLVLMLATYNPYSSSYYHWTAADSTTSRCRSWAACCY